ncbi:DUF3144 domain-containing protein [Candidatus Albibeggiatoa sp. nov. NOAA]|uniref:DUF3144 domain-containing protein n=1 Tax=Candidatus Albibeggiatoa sp. nov. NOAA TaxID=3162724 RepID=UPI0032FE0AF3|nr:DUF3144 domain-containing protein [Thiotrichaceae bacterium]
MSEQMDDAFYDRADEHIHLSNDQISGDIGRGKVSASMMYATARFNAWVSASGLKTAENMADSKEEIVSYFVEQYQKMLEENIDDYISHFEEYMFFDEQ